MSKKNQQIKVGGKNTGKITQSEPEAELIVEDEQAFEALQSAVDSMRSLGVPEQTIKDLLESDAQYVFSSPETTDEEQQRLTDLSSRIENKAFTSYEVKSREIKLEIEGHNPHYVSREIGLSTNLDNG